MLSKVLGGLGRALMAAGVLVLLFIVYQLWGTNIHTARAQDSLGKEFEQILARAGIDEAPDAADIEIPEPTETSEPSDPAHVDVVEAGPVADDVDLPSYGDPMARIQIPSIGVDNIVVSGSDLQQLKRGPAHHADSPLPGQAGNVAMAGHRTTYGAPFHNFDQVEVGDHIVTTTVQGDFVYEVNDVFIVKPHQVEILDDMDDNRITLIACHPKYSLRERIIVTGILLGQPAPQIEGQEEARVTESELIGEDLDEPATDIDGAISASDQPKGPAIMWALVCAAVWLGTWLVSVALRRRVGQRRRRRGLLIYSPYLIGVPIFLVTLYAFFENFALLLPSSY